MRYFRHGNKYVRAGLRKRNGIDSRRVMLAPFLKDGAILASSVMPTNYVQNYGVGDLGNTDCGNCTYASVGHLLSTVRLRNKSGPVVTKGQVIDAYQRTGYVPGIDATDNGAYLLDVIKEWKKDGLYGTKILAFVELDPRDQDEVAFAVSTLGGVIFGFGLPQTAQGQEVWHVQDNASDDDKAAWSLGGHAVYCCDASPGRNAGITWGDRKSWTIPWQIRYASECYAVVLEEMVDGLISPASGLDLDGLLAAAKHAVTL